MTTPFPSSNQTPTEAERFAFETDGFIAKENFLTPDHVARLLEATHRTVARRREMLRTGRTQTGFTQTKSDQSTRVLYILDDDPLFLELLDWPAIMPYVHGLLSKMPHHCASDFIVEHGADFPMTASPAGISTATTTAFATSAARFPLLQLKIGYYLTDMTAPGASHLAGRARQPQERGSLRPRPTASADDFFPALIKSARRPAARSFSTTPSGTPPRPFPSPERGSARCSTTPTNIRG